MNAKVNRKWADVSEDLDELVATGDTCRLLFMKGCREIVKEKADATIEKHVTKYTS